MSITRAVAIVLSAAILGAAIVSAAWILASPTAASWLGPFRLDDSGHQSVRHSASSKSAPERIRFAPQVHAFDVLIQENVPTDRSSLIVTFTEQGTNGQDASYAVATKVSTLAQAFEAAGHKVHDIAHEDFKLRSLAGTGSEEQTHIAFDQKMAYSFETVIDFAPVLANIDLEDITMSAEARYWFSDRNQLILDFERKAEAAARAQIAARFPEDEIQVIQISYDHNISRRQHLYRVPKPSIRMVATVTFNVGALEERQIAGTPEQRLKSVRDANPIVTEFHGFSSD